MAKSVVSVATCIVLFSVDVTADAASSRVCHFLIFEGVIQPPEPESDSSVWLMPGGRASDLVVERTPRLSAFPAVANGAL